MLRISLQRFAQHDTLPSTANPRSACANSASASAGARRRPGCAICRVLLSSFCFALVGRSTGFPVGRLGSLRRLIAGGFDRFLGFSGYGLAGLLGFPSDRLSSLFGFLAYGLGSLFGFLAYGLGSLFGFLPDGFGRLLNCFPCFLRAVLYFLTYPFLTKNRQHSGCNQRDDQARDSHVFSSSCFTFGF